MIGGISPNSLSPSVSLASAMLAHPSHISDPPPTVERIVRDPKMSVASNQPNHHMGKPAEVSRAAVTSVF